MAVRGALLAVLAAGGCCGHGHLPERGALDALARGGVRRVAIPDEGTASVGFAAGPNLFIMSGHGSPRVGSGEHAEFAFEEAGNGRRTDTASLTLRSDEWDVSVIRFDAGPKGLEGIPIDGRADAALRSCVLLVCGPVSEPAGENPPIGYRQVRRITGLERFTLDIREEMLWLAWDGPDPRGLSGSPVMGYDRVTRRWAVVGMVISAAPCSFRGLAAGYCLEVVPGWALADLVTRVERGEAFESPVASDRRVGPPIRYVDPNGAEYTIYDLDADGRILVAEEEATGRWFRVTGITLQPWGEGQSVEIQPDQPDGPGEAD